MKNMDAVFGSGLFNENGGTDNNPTIIDLGILNSRDRMLDGDWITPPLKSGCLPGILRQIKLQSGAVREAVVTINELLKCRQIRVGNSLRGEILAELL